jgi:hypothetical protein
MDGHRFDDLTKRLAVGTSRRRVIKGLAGSVAGGLAVLAGRHGADARRRTQASCGNTVCAGDPGICNDGCVCCEYANGNSRCMPPNRCTGEVVCPGGLEFCDGSCTTLGTMENCSSCGDTCGVNEVCGENGCECSGAGLTDINGFCFRTIPDNSAASGQMCRTAGPQCHGAGSVSGTGSYVCIAYTGNICDENCPTGVCQNGDKCVAPC